MGWESGEITGTLTNREGEALFITAPEKKYAKKIWIGQRYTGPPIPEIGFYGVWQFSTSPPKEGRQYGSSYLDAYQAASPVAAVPNPPQEAVRGPSEAPGKPLTVQTPMDTREAFIATRWAFSTAIDCLPRQEGVALKVSDIVPVADELFQAAWSEALKHMERIEGKRTEASADEF